MKRRLWLALSAALLAPALAVALRLVVGSWAHGGAEAALVEPGWSFALRVSLCAAGLVAAVFTVGLRPGGGDAARTWRSSLNTALLGAAMVAAATWVLPVAIHELRALGEDGVGLPTIDLTQGPLPERAEGLVRLRGYLRDELVLDEYRVAPGEQPDQNRVAPARLVPLLGTLDDELRTSGRVVVARVPARRGAATRQATNTHDPLDGTVSLTGVLAPLPPEIMTALFDRAPIEHVGAAPQVRGVMLDTLRAPTVEHAAVKVSLGVGAALLGFALLFFAAPTGRAREE